VNRKNRGRVSSMLICFALTCAAGCGSLNPTLVAVNDNDTEEDACLDLWTLVHVGSGYYIGTRLDEDSAVPTAVMLAGYEVLEPLFWPGFNESELNQSCDIVVGMLGWLVEQLARE